jgi:SAM-dependent methyltransferase
MTAGLPFKDAAFDVVTLISTIEHVQDPDALVREVDRVLSPGGHVVVQIPNPYFPIDLHYFLPFYGYLPPVIRKAYRRLVTGQRYTISYHTAQVSKRDVVALFPGYAEPYSQDVVYPLDVAPDWLRPFWDLYTTSGLHRLFPTGHLFVYRKPQQSAVAHCSLG